MPPAPRACPRCRRSIAPAAKFCPHCGGSLTTRSTTWRRWLGFGFGGLLALCVALGVLGAILGDDEGDATPTTLSALAESEPTATVVATSPPAPTATDPPTEALEPTATVTPRPTETPLPSAALPAGVPQRAVKVTVVDVIDGDTIRVQVDGRRDTVRLIGIDTPETRDPNDPVECFGAEATERTSEKIPPGTTIWMESDITDRDRYDRLLRYVWYVREENGRTYMLNERLVAEGYAVISTYPPDVQYVERFRRAQDLAQEEGRGLWPACGGADTPLSQPTSTPVPVPQQPAPAPGGNCDPSYPGVCIPPWPPDLDCGDISHRRFQVIPPDPHGFDRDGDGIGCESG